MFSRLTVSADRLGVLESIENDTSALLNPHLQCIGVELALETRRNVKTIVPIGLPLNPAMSQNAQTNFRSQLSGFRWANSVQDDSAATAQNQGNVFSRTWTGLSGYIPLRNEGRSQEEEAYFALSVSSEYGMHRSFELGELIEGVEVGTVPWLSGMLCRRNGMFRYRLFVSTNTSVRAFTSGRSRGYPEDSVR